ncbi:tail fiber protein [Dickeya phage Coodle]|uniref:Tail fiber protein n=1 Tax=Dickeya phage Coodle TaxID=2320188 RepID=A0A3G2K8S9_9CAUD|nr:tail fiber protein [Dickeya phage Coodle]
MPTITVLVAPEVVRNKPETERLHVVTGTAKGWEKTSLNQDPDEILTECKGLDALLTKSNLEADGVTKVDPTKPIGFEISYEIHDPSAVLATGLTITPATTGGEVGQVVELLATVAPANATYQGVNWYSGDISKAVHIGGGKFKLLASGSVTVYGVTIEGGHTDSTVITVSGALSLTTDLAASMDVTGGADATFTVVAAGGTTPYTYVWHFSDVPGGAGTVIDAGVNPSAATASLVNHAVTASSEGEYWCVVSDADAHTVTSARCEMAVV